MRVMRSRLVPLALLLALAACGGGTVDPAAPDPSDNLTLGIPPALGGLTVKSAEKTTSMLRKEATKRSTYVRDVTVFELRRGKELKGIFEVIRLTPDARIEDLEFRKRLAGLVLGSQRAPKDIGGVPVYDLTSKKGVINMWFEDRFMQILLVQSDPSGTGAVADVEINRLLAEALALELRPVTPEGEVEI